MKLPLVNPLKNISPNILIYFSAHAMVSIPQLPFLMEAPPAGKEVKKITTLIMFDHNSFIK